MLSSLGDPLDGLDISVGWCSEQVAFFERLQVEVPRLPSIWGFEPIFLGLGFGPGWGVECQGSGGLFVIPAKGFRAFQV